MKKIVIIILAFLFCKPLIADVVLEPASLNLYKVKKGAVVTRSFTIYNTASVDYVINRIYGDCSCVSVGPYGKIIPPYGNIEVSVTFDSNRENDEKFSKTVFVLSPSGEKKLEIYGQVVPDPSDESKYPKKSEALLTHKENTAERHPVVKQDSPSPVYIAFFSSSKCGKCAKVKKMLESLKKTVSHLSVREFDVAEKENRVILEAMSGLYKVKDTASIAPPVLFLTGPNGDRYLQGEDIAAEKITESAGTKGLAQKIKDVVPPWERTGNFRDEAVSKIRNRFENFQILPVIIAGLVDGINPCAFGVLLFFISYTILSLKRSNKETLFIGINFTFGVFVAYFLLGFGLLKFIGVIRSYYLIAKTFYIMVGIFAIFLSILSFMDFYSAFKIKQNKPVKILLKLPLGFFNNIFKVVETFAEFKHFIAASFAVGFIVSLLEFFCTGQIYFPTLVYIIGIPELRLRAATMLLIYCLAFVVPLLVVFILFFIGIRTEKIENFNKQHLGAVKFLNGIIFLCFGIFILLSIK